MKIIPYSTRLLLLSHFFSYVYSQLFLILQTITTRLWKTSKPEEQQHAVPAHQKEMLWAELKDMFTLSEGVDQELVKKCALRKMTLAFATFKKLYTNYIQKDKEPNWTIFLRLNLTGRSSNNTNYQRMPKENLNRPRQMHQRRSTTTTLGLPGTRSQLKNGRRWSRTLWIEASGRRLGIGRIDPSGGYLLMAWH